MRILPFAYMRTSKKAIVILPPTVVTGTIQGASITDTFARMLGSQVTSDGGASVTSKGVVWSTSGNPTIALSTKTNNGTGLTSFDSDISGLSPGLTYYVRAYATNSSGTGYGSQVSFGTQTAPPSVGLSIIMSAEFPSPSYVDYYVYAASNGGVITQYGVIFNGTEVAVDNVALQPGQSVNTYWFSNTSACTTYSLQAYAYSTLYGLTVGPITYWTTGGC